MSQRYFITAESTYEDLRQALNASLDYPNTLGKSVFQTALYAPRDNFRRVLLAVDTDIPGYATINAALQPLLDSDAMEEISESTYLSAVASATAGITSLTFTDVADTLTYTNFQTEAGTLADALSGIDSAISGKAASSHSHVVYAELSDALLEGGEQVIVDIGAAAAVHAHSVTADITAGNWKIFHSNGSGAIVELALGASGTVLTSNGTANAPTFQAVQGESFHPFLLAGM